MPPIYPATRSAVGLELDFREIGKVLRRRRRVLAGCVLLGTAAVLLVTFQLTPRYTASGQILIDPRERKVVDLDSVLAGLSPETSTIESQVEVLRSRSLANRVIEVLELERDPEFNPALRESGPLAGAIGWFARLTRGEPETVPEARRRERQLAAAATLFQRALAVERLGRLSFVISISFTSEDPERAAGIVNTLADAYLVEQLEAKFEAIQRATTWLNKRLGALREQVRTSENAVEAYRAGHGLLDLGGTTVSEQQLSDINGQLVLARAELAEKRARYDRVDELLQSGKGAESVAEVLASGVVTDLRQQQAVLARKRGELASRYGERHPRMVNLLAEHRDLDAELEAEVSRIVAHLENEVEVVRSRAESLSASLSRLQGEAAQNERASVRLRELEREAEANRTLYESFLGRFLETREQQSIQEADARVISAAVVPTAPSYPNRPLTLLVGLMTSALMGLAAVFFLEWLDNGFHTGRQLTVELQLPHLGSVPELTDAEATVDGMQRSPADFTLARPDALYSEALRGLRATLLQMDVDTSPSVILVTSSVPQEGKTTLVSSMGRAAASAGLRTLVIDADLRHPRMARALGVEAKGGLVELLAGEVSLADVLVRDPESGLDLLPVDGRAASPPDLLASDAMRTLIEKLKSDFDLILLDSPPVLGVVDAKVLSRVSDKVLFVVHWEKTPREAAANAVHALRAFDADLIGAVFTRLDPERFASYEVYDCYRYVGEHAG